MTWTMVVYSKHPLADCERCCEACIDVTCTECGRRPDAIAEFADDDADGEIPLSVIRG